MNSPQIRLTRKLFNEMQCDLRRPHPFAGERVGFAYGRLANASSPWPLVLLTRYVQIEDERYLPDMRIGARIDGEAIQAAMQGVIDNAEGCFHVHLHGWPGRPRFSAVDLHELPHVARSLQKVGPMEAHGLFLLSNDSAHAEVWMPGKKDPVLARINIVGFPMAIIEAKEP